MIAQSDGLQAGKLTKEERWNRAGEVVVPQMEVEEGGAEGGELRWDFTTQRVEERKRC